MSTPARMPIFTRFSYMNGPPSPPSPSNYSCEDELEKMDLAPVHRGVLTRLKTSTFPLHMTWAEMTHSPTPPSTPIGERLERPPLVERSKTAPAVFRPRRYKGESDQEYHALSKERREAAKIRVNHMRAYLGLKTMEESAHDRRPSVISHSSSPEATSPPKSCESIQPVNITMAESLRRYSTAHVPTGSFPPPTNPLSLSRSNSLPTTIPAFLPTRIL